MGFPRSRRSTTRICRSRWPARYPEFVPTDYLEPKEARRTDPFAQYAIASAKLAWADAGEPEVRSERGAVIYATGIGGVQTLLNQHDVLREKGAGRVSPFMVPMLMANAAGGHIAMNFGLTGPNYCTVSACSSSNHAIGEAMRLIRDGYSDLVIAGGSEAATIPLTVAAFAQMTALTKNPDPETASRPFDADRNGFVLSEGGCALIMESEEHARGSRSADLLRGRRLRRLRRRPPHHRSRPEGLGRGPGHDVGPGRRGRRARGRDATSTRTAPPPR